MQHTTSVILCAYTEARWDDLLRAVASLRQQTAPPTEIIIAVDHNETLAARVRQALPDVIVVENSGARGLSGARNAGIAAAHGSLIVFLDDDAVAAPDWLAQLVAAYDDPKVMGVGGAILPNWLAARPDWFPSEFDWVVGCTYTGMPKTPSAVRNLIGCNMSFRREVFAAIGDFRIGRVGALSIGQENDETELCIRLGAAQPEARLLYLPQAKVFHSVPPTRTTWRYFVRRCFSEGMSKARLAQQAGSGPSLSTERTYVSRTLPAAVVRGLGETGRGDIHGLRRAATVVGGLGVTGAGYISGIVLPLLARHPRTTPNVAAEPARASQL